MKFESTVFRSMLSVAVLAGTFAAQVSAAQDPRKEIDAEIDARQKANYRDIVEFLEGRVASDDARTNAALRVHIDRKILTFCATPGWIRLGRWDKEWSDGRVPAVCEREIDAADCPPGEEAGGDVWRCKYVNKAPPTLEFELRGTGWFPGHGDISIRRE